MPSHALRILLRSHGFGKTAPQMGSGIGIDDVPHFGFSLGTVPAPSQVVIRMYLNRKILFRIDEFDQQRKFVAETGVIGFSEQITTLPSEQLGQRQTGIGPLGDDRFAPRNARQLPTFADLRTVGNDLLVSDEFLPAPQHRFQYGYKFVHALFIAAPIIGAE